MIIVVADLVVLQQAKPIVFTQVLEYSYDQQWYEFILFLSPCSVSGCRSCVSVTCGLVKWSCPTGQPPKQAIP